MCFVLLEDKVASYIDGNLVITIHRHRPIITKTKFSQQDL